MSKLVYVTITMPERFKKLLDKEAERHYMKKSEFIRAAVLKYIEFLDRDDPSVGDRIDS